MRGMSVDGGKYCFICGRQLASSYKGMECPMCTHVSDPQATPAQSTLPANWQQGSPSPYQTSQQAGSLPGATLYGGMGPVVAEKDMRAVRQIVGLERVTAVVWVVIAIIQIIGVVTIPFGIWNIMVCINRFRRAEAIEALHPDIPTAFERELGSIIIFIALNLFLGGVIGVVACIMDLAVRSQVLRMRHVFEQASPIVYQSSYSGYN
jgi:hypothetical protein